MRTVLASLMAAAALASPAMAEPTAPVVVELFTSQGCSSCPPANDTLARLADRPDVLALSFGVTYWDDLGWKDTFADAAYTARQWDYAKGLGHRQVWTPQMLVDGRADTTGTKPGAVEPLIVKAKALHAGQPQVAVNDGAVTITAGAAAKPAQVWLVRYDPRTVQVPVRRGENNGRTLPHRNVVHELTSLGVWSGARTTLVLPPSHDASLKTAVLVQAGRGGPILAAARG